MPLFFRTLNIRSFLLLVVVMIPSVSFCGDFYGTLPEQSRAAIEYGFDIMETFDDIKDWRGSVLNGMSTNQPASDFPKRLDNSDTPFTMYSNWKLRVESADDWIKDHRSNGGHIWDPLHKGTGKSLCMDISKRGYYGLGDGKNWGPDRFGLVFNGGHWSDDGTSWEGGSRENGYNEMYLFFMLWMPKQMWPTHEEGRIGAADIGYYRGGEDYLGNNGLKFLDHGHGFVYPWVHGDGYGSGSEIEYYGAKSTYGWHFDNTKLHPHNNQPELMEEYGDHHNLPSDGAPPRSPCENEYRVKKYYYTNVEIPTSQWVGIEVYHKLNDPGRDNGIVRMWYYEQDGTAHVVSVGILSGCKLPVYLAINIICSILAATTVTPIYGVQVWNRGFISMILL